MPVLTSESVTSDKSLPLTQVLSAGTAAVPFMITSCINISSIISATSKLPALESIRLLELKFLPQTDRKVLRQKSLHMSGFIIRLTEV